MAISELRTVQDLEDARKTCTDKCLVLLFWAEWHPPCNVLRDQMNEMSKVHDKIKFTWVSIRRLRDNKYLYILMMLV